MLWRKEKYRRKGYEENQRENLERDKRKIGDEEKIKDKRAGRKTAFEEVIEEERVAEKVMKRIRERI